VSERQPSQCVSAGSNLNLSSTNHRCAALTKTRATSEWCCLKHATPLRGCHAGRLDQLTLRLASHLMLPIVERSGNISTRSRGDVALALTAAISTLAFAWSGCESIEWVRDRFLLSDQAAAASQHSLELAAEADRLEERDTILFVWRAGAAVRSRTNLLATAPALTPARDHASGVNCRSAAHRSDFGIWRSQSPREQDEDAPREMPRALAQQGGATWKRPPAMWLSRASL
jgi:hypothetical protein